MNSPTLIIMAAGRGSRYGSLKQIDRLGPHGESILEYTIYDAQRAGFGQVVIVLRSAILKEFREVVGCRLEAQLDVEYVLQDRQRGVRDRARPWGTGQAVMSASEHLRGPFAVANADDLYGQQSIHLLRQQLTADTTQATLVGYELRNTLSENGTVNRGVCHTTNFPKLAAIEETIGIAPDGRNATRSDAQGHVHRIDGHTLVSMNLWGFPLNAIDLISNNWHEFYRRHHNDDQAEFYLTAAIDPSVSPIDIVIVPTGERWFGVTHMEDRQTVIRELKSLSTVGAYPAPLWSTRTPGYPN